MTRVHRYKQHKAQKVLAVQKKYLPRFIDRLIYVAAVVEPVITLPQIYQIFRTQNATGVSISSWSGYLILNLIWLWYGIAHKDKMIQLYSTLSSFTMIAVIIGAMMYGGKWL